MADSKYRCAGSFHPPPRMYRPLCDFDSLMHHSRTLPAMSSAPEPAIPPKDPTGVVPSRARAMLLAAMMEPLASNRAACDHWKTLGSRFLRKRAYASASYQLTPDTG